jgi:predicted metal-dependent hydrolase
MATFYEVQLEGVRLRYQVRRSRATRHIRLLLYADGRCVVTGPKRLTLAQAALIARENSQRITDWLAGFPSARQPVPVKKTHSWRVDVPAARALVQQKLTHWNQFYQAAYGQVRIKHTTSRWGSCSARKNLNFHVGIVHLPEPLQDYLIVHELCHVLELNHSPRFWALVGQTIPDFVMKRRALRRLQPTA